MKFVCQCCGKEYDEVPALGADRPTPYYDVPEDKIEEDVYLTEDACVIAERFFFIRGCLDIPIKGTSDHFQFGVWTSLKEENFFIWQDHFEVQERDHIGPFFGWFCSALPAYSDTLHLKSMVHIRNNGIRPSVVLDESDHPLAIDQRNGISLDRLGEILHTALDTPPTG